MTRVGGFTLAVVGILALGIGANSTIFSVLNAVVLRPIPWEHPERLVNLLEVNAKQGGYLTAASKANYKDWREQSRLLERMAAFRAVYFNIASVADIRTEPERVPGMAVSVDFFPLIGVKPALGRIFLREEEQPGRDHVVLLSDRLWQRRYGAGPSIAGRSISIEGESYTVAGVLSDFPMFRILDHPIALYTPLTLPNACANIASLTLARFVSRRKELAIRVALGAGRLRMVRRLLAESLLLALAGGVLGAMLAAGGAAFLDRHVSTLELHRMRGFRVDLTVLALTVGISLTASVLFGLGPAIRASKFDMHGTLAQASGRGSTGGRVAGGLIIASEVALATMLLIGAAVAARSTLRLLRMDRGLDPHNVLTAQLWLPASRYATGAAQRQFMDMLLQRLRALPGVAGASAANYPPLGILVPGDAHSTRERARFRNRRCR